MQRRWSPTHHVRHRLLHMTRKRPRRAHQPDTSVVRACDLSKRHSCNTVRRVPQTAIVIYRIDNMHATATYRRQVVWRLPAHPWCRPTRRQGCAATRRTLRRARADFLWACFAIQWKPQWKPRQLGVRERCLALEFQWKPNGSPNGSREESMILSVVFVY